MPSTAATGIAKASAASGERAGGHVVDAGELAIVIVLAHVDDRQRPDRRHVEALEHGALVERAVAEERDRDPILVLRLGAERRAGCERHAAADDAVGAEVAGPRIHHVHGAAAPHAVAALLAEDFRNQPHRVGAAREAMAVAAMMAGDVIGGASAAATPTATASWPE